MDDLMARTMIETLCLGINPTTGEVLSDDDSCSDPVVQEALKIVLEACSLESYSSIIEKQHREKKEKKAQRASYKKGHYQNNGKPWSREDTFQMMALYNKGYPIPRIAYILRRSPGAIFGQIKKQMQSSQE